MMETNDDIPADESASTKQDEDETSQAQQTNQAEAEVSHAQQSNQEEVVEETVTFVTTDDDETVAVPVQVTAAGHIIQQEQTDDHEAQQGTYEAQVVEQPSGESSDQLHAADDQEMGLAVAILELIGSRPHITVANPTTENNPQEQFVNVPIRDPNQPAEQALPSEQGDNANQQQIYPVTLQQSAADDEGQITADAAVTAAAAVGEKSAAVAVDNPVDNGDKSKGGKKKRGRQSKGGKKKNAEERSEDQPSKKKKKTEKESEGDASTTNDTETKDKVPKNFSCPEPECKSTFNRKDNLKVHMRSKHKTELEEETSSRTKCLNPGCEQTFYHKTQMLRHMEEEHGLAVQKTEMEFKSLDEFKKWKTEEETKKYVFFSSYRGPSANKAGKGSHLYFKCQKDGPNRPHRKLGEPERKSERRNRKGSVKTGLLCPARMICKVDGKTGKVKLTYIHSHSHPITCEDTEHQPVPEALKKELMDKLANGTPVKQLYKDVRKVSIEGPKSSPHAVEAVHHITLRSLDLLKHRVEMKRRLHHNERTSVLLLVEKLKAEKHNPVLIYKPHGSAAVVGDESLMHLPFADDLSVLALQTEEQLKFIKQVGAKVVCVDTTYVSNPTDLKLISLTVPDGHQQGYAVAYLIANRIDEHLLYYFIKAIKERCGEEFQPSTIMTDEDNTGYGVFQAVFPNVNFNHLFSKWHIHRAWLKRMSRDIQNTSLRHEIYHSLFLMMEESNVSKFNDMASNFVTHYATKSQTFTEYFVEMYRARPELWAMSYREQSSSDVIFMNNYHSNLKAFYGQKRKASKRIDSLVNILLDIDKDAAWRRVKRVYEASSDTTDVEYSSHHDRGMLITEDQIEDCSAEEQDKVWLVPNYNDKDMKHKVTKLYNVCSDDNCTLKCLETSCFSLCHHLYECSCFDEIDICQHIHRVHSLRISQLQMPQALTCTPAADLGAYVEIHYMDEDETVGVATQNVQTMEVTTAEVVPVVAETEEAAAAVAAADSGNVQVGSLQSRLQHLVNLLGSRQVDDILLNHVTGTVDQLITTCEAASNPAAQVAETTVEQLNSAVEAAESNPPTQT